MLIPTHYEHLHANLLEPFNFKKLLGFVPSFDDPVRLGMQIARNTPAKTPPFIPPYQGGR